MPDQEDEPEPEEVEAMSVLSPTPWQLFEKCLTWLEYQLAVNQYNAYMMRKLHALTVCKLGESLKSRGSYESWYKSKCMYEHMHVYLYNVVFDCISLI